MSRPPRYTYEQAVHHVTLRCNNREFLFDDASHAMFVDTLQEARSRYPIRLYNYCLMTNHVHLLFRVRWEDTLSKVMHWLSTNFCRRFNKGRGRIGHLWQGRFRSTIIEQATYFFRCMAYVDLNPVRAGMTSSPEEHTWSAHRAVREEDLARIDLHPLYLAAGDDPASRYRFYSGEVDAERLREPTSLAGVYFAGSKGFLDRMAGRFGLTGRARATTRRACAGDLWLLGPQRGGTRAL